MVTFRRHALSLTASLVFLGLAFGSTDDKTPEQRAQAQCEDKIAAFVMSQEFVKRQLKAPATADFPSFTAQGVSVTYLSDCTHEVRAYVDAQNAFGALIRNNYYVKLKNQLGTDTWSPLEVQLQPR